MGTSSLWYFSECKHKKKSCVLDLNDALLRLYYHPRIEMKKTTKNKQKTMLQIVPPSKNLAVKFLLYVLEHTNLASTIKKRKKYLKSDNTPPIKIVANKKNTQICTNFKTNYFLMLLLLYKKNICVIG